MGSSSTTNIVTGALSDGLPFLLIITIDNETPLPALWQVRFRKIIRVPPQKSHCAAQIPAVVFSLATFECQNRECGYENKINIRGRP
jgi:hypothetical protein